MAKYKPDYFRGEGRGPVDYDQVSDPLHGVDPSLLQDDGLLKRLVDLLKSYIASPKTFPFEAEKDRIEKAWLKAGGSRGVFNKAMETAFIKSKFYKEISRDARLAGV